MFRPFAILALVLSAGLLQFAQIQKPDRPPDTRSTSTAPAYRDRQQQQQPAPSPDEVRRKKAMEKDQVHQRYLEMQRDTDTLITLASELKKEVDRAGQETLSLDVIKKAETIEKLAKSVRLRMKGD